MGIIQHEHSVTATFIISIVLIARVDSTTEWFGDLRAHMNPSRSPAFSDVIYDEIECPMGIESDAIPDYVYFGPMVATMSVSKHADCLNHCIQNPRCVAVNFFEPMTFQERGFCELLSENQLDNPRLMRPFKQAVYYENIKCRLDDDTQQNELKIRPASFSGKRLTSPERPQSGTQETIGKSARIQHEIPAQALSINNDNITYISTSMITSVISPSRTTINNHSHSGMPLKQASRLPLPQRRVFRLHKPDSKQFLLRLRASPSCCKISITPLNIRRRQIR
uniref:Apple domain-containing protein n=1 Tax=Parascaris univalens TaxID=6257 RepID=A0A915BJW8_PARUN